MIRMLEVQRWIDLFKENGMTEMDRPELVKIYAEKYGISPRAASDRLRPFEEWVEELVDKYGDQWREKTKHVYFYRSGGKTKGGRVEWTGREPIDI